MSLTSEIELSKECITEISAVEGLLGNQVYQALAVEPTINYMRVMYVDAMVRHINIEDAILCDCAAGYGWLSFAFLLSGGKRSIIVEPHKQKLDAAREIAGILGVAERCEFLDDKVQDIDLPDQSVDIFASVETLEHVGKANLKPSIANIRRLTHGMIVLTAPNQLFPVVSHDSMVPFSHWLPIRWRPFYCRLWGKREIEFNHFPGPWHLNGLFSKFRPVSKVLVFDEYRSWLDHYPCYSPYDGGQWKEAPSAGTRWFLLLISKVLGRYSYWACPNLANVWLAKK